MLSLYDIQTPSISQVHIYFRATLLSPTVGSGAESLEVKLVRWKDVQWYVALLSSRSPVSSEARRGVKVLSRHWTGTPLVRGPHEGQNLPPS